MYVHLLQRVIDYIEKQLKQKLTLEEVASYSGLSKYHLHRLFRVMAGQPLMEYIRRRRLSCSLRELLQSRMKIIDIAVEYAFEHEQSYIRSFKRMFGMSPARCRMLHAEVMIQERIRLIEYLNLGIGVLFKPSFVMKPAFQLTGLMHVIDQAVNEETFTASKVALDFMLHHRFNIEQPIQCDVYYGLTDYFAHHEGQSNYLTSVQTKIGSSAPCGYSTRSVSSGMYAVFTYIGSHNYSSITLAQLKDIYEYIFELWLPSGPYEQAAPFHIERVDTSINDAHYCEAQIYIPIKEK